MIGNDWLQSKIGRRSKDNCESHNSSTKHHKVLIDFIENDRYYLVVQGKELHHWATWLDIFGDL